MRYWQILVEQELMELGGNAFKDGVIVRIDRANIDPTIRYIASQLKYPEFDYEYIKNHLMGSTGKKASSGDIDIAIDDTKFVLRDLAARVRAVLGEEFIRTGGLKGGQFNSAWPIVKPDGSFELGRIQVDFIVGNPEWLMFSHHSAGDDSKYPGVYISTMLGVLAKINKDWELWDEGSDRLDRLDRIARVGLKYDLEKGVKRVWELRKKKGMGASDVDPDYWESHVPVPNPPRFARINYIDNPQAVIDILLPGASVSDVDTFEKLWAVIKHHPKYSDKLDDIKERFMDSIDRSSAIKNTASGTANIPDEF